MLTQKVYYRNYMHIDIIDILYMCIGKMISLTSKICFPYYIFRGIIKILTGQNSKSIYTITICISVYVTIQWF